MRRSVNNEQKMGVWRHKTMFVMRSFQYLSYNHRVSTSFRQQRKEIGWKISFPNNIGMITLEQGDGVDEWDSVDGLHWKLVVQNLSAIFVRFYLPAKSKLPFFVGTVLIITTAQCSTTGWAHRNRFTRSFFPGLRHDPIGIFGWMRLWCAVDWKIYEMTNRENSRRGGWRVMEWWCVCDDVVMMCQTLAHKITICMYLKKILHTVMHMKYDFIFDISVCARITKFSPFDKIWECPSILINMDLLENMSLWDISRHNFNGYY